MQIRSKPGIGVYVEDLTPVPVSSYGEHWLLSRWLARWFALLLRALRLDLFHPVFSADIERRMEEGTSYRTIASTKMNATSSRAHTVVGIMFTSIVKDPGTGVTAEMTARMNLVDLAGSERAESTGATGDRLKEGCAINASLSVSGTRASTFSSIVVLFSGSG